MRVASPCRRRPSRPCTNSVRSVSLRTGANEAGVDEGNATAALVCSVVSFVLLRSLVCRSAITLVDSPLTPSRFQPIVGSAFQLQLQMEPARPELSDDTVARMLRANIDISAQLQEHKQWLQAQTAQRKGRSGFERVQRGEARAEKLRGIPFLISCATFRFFFAAAQLR